jgi:hypothetical protein
VAITRAVKNIYIFEQRADHPALKLLQMQESNAEIQVSEVKSSREEWLDEARRLEEQGKYEQAEQIRAKYFGYEYISPEQLETIKALALDPSKKEAEVKKERKQLFQYAINHRNYDWVDALARLQFQRAVLYMKEIRGDRKEYEKHLRLGNQSKIVPIVQKYGVDFTTDEGSSGLMLAVYHGQSELAGVLLAQGASCLQTDKKNRLALDYLLASYLKNKQMKQKQLQLADEHTLIRFWEKIRPSKMVYEYANRQFHIGSHSMLYFLITLMRNTADSQPSTARYKAPHKAEPFTTGAFNMSELEQFAAMIPDEILPPYRKKRTYINSIMALNERYKDSPYCKSAFIRVERGWYILNPDISEECTD